MIVRDVYHIYNYMYNNIIININNKYRSRTIVVDFRHRFTVINMNDTPVLLVKYIYFIHMYNGKPVTEVYSDRPGTIIIQQQQQQQQQ